MIKVLVTKSLGDLFKVATPCAFVHSYRYPTPYVHHNPLVQPVPTSHKLKNKHWNPKFKRDRKEKSVKIELPDFNEKSMDTMTPEEIRIKYKKMGIQPRPHSDERAVFISSTSTAIDPYIPPEGDGKAGLMSVERAKQSMSFLTKKGGSYRAMRKLKQYEQTDFNLSKFTESALEIYINLHKALCEYDEDKLHMYATERAFPLVTHETKNKTIRWSFIKSLEPARVVHARVTSLIEDDNLFAQITVRFNTKQTLAVYDRFGRLIHGSEVIARDVLEYVVFEKHISNIYGIWRVHEKIVPDWMHVTPLSHLTFKLPKLEDLEDEPPKTDEPAHKDKDPQKTALAS